MAIWPKASSKRVAASLKAHSAIAVAAGALIYILAVTGTLSVFNHDLQRWEQPDAPEMAAISPGAAERAAHTVFESEAAPTAHLYVNLPKPDLPRTVITTDNGAVFATATGEIAGREHFPFTQFLLDLHYYLHLPHVLGLTVVGALGAVLLGLSLSGFLAHPRIFRDAFTMRRGRGRLTLADLHNRLSVWTAPFHLSNALTGAILGLATIMAVALSATRIEGGTGAVFAPIFGDEAPADTRPAGLPAIAAPLSDMAERHRGLEPTHVIVHDPGTMGQHVQIVAEHPRRLVFGDYYNYDAQGVYHGNTGISDGTAGQQIVGSVYNVHFGNWGGLPVKLAYLGFGVSLSVVVASGLGIYFARRAERGRPAPQLEGAWEGVVWGTPAALALSLLAAMAVGAEGGALVALFWLPLAGAVAAGAFWGKARAGQASRFCASGLLILSLTAHAARYGADVLSPAALGIEAGLLIAALLLILPESWRLLRGGPAGLRRTA